MCTYEGSISNTKVLIDLDADSIIILILPTCTSQMPPLLF